MISDSDDAIVFCVEIEMTPTTLRGSVASGRSLMAWPRAARADGRRATWNARTTTVGWLTVVCLAMVGVVAANGDDMRLMQRQRRRAQDQPLDDVSWSNLRRFVCGSVENVKCMNDER